jgi:F-type H+-transporting ATPase subunit delta
MPARLSSPGGAIYAAALFEAADAAGGTPLLEEAGAALQAVASAWEGDRALRAFFLASSVPATQKQAALVKLATRLPKLVGHFLRLLHRRGRLAMLPQVAAAYAEALDARLGRVPVTLTTAVPVPEREYQDWVAAIRRTIGGEPIVEHQVRPEILAGAVVRVGDRVADGSARRRLAELRKNIVERGTHFHALQS